MTPAVFSDRASHSYHILVIIFRHFINIFFLRISWPAFCLPTRKLCTTYGRKIKQSNCLFFCSTCFSTLGSFWSFPIDFFSPNCVSIEVKNVALQICWLVISLQSFCDKKRKILVIFCQPVLFPGLVLTAERKQRNHFFSDGWLRNYFPT